MTEEKNDIHTYMDRLDDQINWYDSKSQIYKKRYYVLTGINLCISASIPFLINLIVNLNYMTLIISALSVINVIVTGLESLHSNHDLWTKYRITCENLKREKIFFETKTGPYSTDSTSQQLDLLVHRCEEYMGNENLYWKKLNTKKEAMRKNV